MSQRKTSTKARQAVRFFGAVALAAAQVVPAGSQEPAAKAEFGESIEVEVVNVDVVVTDKSGRRVLDLGRGDFELLVDGKKVPIEYFAAPRPVAGAPEAPAAAPEEEAAPTMGNLLVFVDQSALDARTSSTLVEEIRSFVMVRAQEGDRVLIAAFADGLQILAPGASDFATLDKAFAELTAIQGRGSRLAAERRHLEQEIRLSGQQRTSPGSTITPVDASALRMQIDRFADEEVDRQRRMVAALGHWVATLSGVEGRKSLLLATPGISANPAAYLYELADLEERSGSGEPGVRQGSLQTTDLNVYHDYERLLVQAQDARVAVYTIAPREGAPQANSPEFGTTGPAVVAPPPRDPSIAEAASSLARLADATGGSTLVLDDSLGDYLGAVADDADSAYSLGFTTGPAAGTKKHEIRVKLLREGLEARNREAYRRHTVAERLEEALTAAASFNLVNGAIALTLEPGEPAAAKKGKTSKLPVVLRIPIGAIALAPTRDGQSFLGTVQVRLAVADAKGGVHLGESTPVEIRVPKGDLERARAAAWPHRAEVTLGSGESRIGALVVDAANGTWATTARAITIP
jgi:VWFA-related protein